MSPEVWDDAYPRIAAVATSLGISLKRPIENPVARPHPVAMWAEIGIGGDDGESIEIGGAQWDEAGSIFIHLLIPEGSDIRVALVASQQFRNAFRGVTDAAAGVLYRGGQSFIMEQDETPGLYRRLTRIVRYHFQDRTS